MVIGGPEDKQPNEDLLDEDDDESIENHDEDGGHGVDSSGAIKQGASFPFSDNARARIRRVKC